MSGDVLHSWAEESQSEIDRLTKERAALVEALKSMRTASTIEEAMIAEQKSDAALKAAGEGLS